LQIHHHILQIHIRVAGREALGHLLGLHLGRTHLVDGRLEHLTEIGAAGGARGLGGLPDATCEVARNSDNI
jgi:hypothetical protein